MPGFVTDAALKSEIVALLHKTALVTQWDTIVPRANAKAYADIVTGFASRGYTKAQVDSWDQGGPFQLSQGIFWSLTTGAVIEPDNYSKDFIQAFDIREQLKEIALTAVGVILEPEGEAGQVTTGPLSQWGDLFKFGPLDEDSRRDDTVTRF